MNLLDLIQGESRLFVLRLAFYSLLAIAGFQSLAALLLARQVWKRTEDRAYRAKILAFIFMIAAVVCFIPVTITAIDIPTEVRVILIYAGLVFVADALGLFCWSLKTQIQDIDELTKRLESHEEPPPKRDP